MSKIAVTGANGFVGQHLIAELLAQDYEVLAIGGSNLPNVPSNDRVTSVMLDLTSADEVAKLDLTEISAVIHLAGLATVGPSFDNPLQYIHTNAALEINLFQRAIEQQTTPRFLIISSASMYDPSAELPLNESSPIIPNSPYAVSKITQEQLGRYYGKRGFEVIICRPFNHIGPGQNPGFLAPDLASQVVAFERGEIDQILVGNLDARRDYTDVRDIARAYRLLLEKGKPGETYNICSGASHSGHDILAAISKQANGTLPIKQDPAKMRPADTLDIYGSHDKLTQQTGWQPKIDLQTTLADVMSDWRQRP